METKYPKFTVYMAVQQQDGTVTFTEAEADETPKLLRVYAHSQGVAHYRKDNLKSCPWFKSKRSAIVVLHMQLERRQKVTEYKLRHTVRLREACEQQMKEMGLGEAKRYRGNEDPEMILP